MAKRDFIEELLQLGKRDVSMELGSIWSTAQASGDIQPGSRQGSGDRKLVRGNITSEGEVFWLNRLHNRILRLRTGWVDQTSPAGA